MTGSVLPKSPQRFREGIIRRDGHGCVVSQVRKENCDAVHLIPRNKGDEYIARVIELRSQAPRDNIGIDDIRNGLLLNKILHSELGGGGGCVHKDNDGTKQCAAPRRHKEVSAR